MHKFTIFTIIFSIMVIFVVADLVINDYWGENFAKEEVVEVPTENIPVDLASTPEPIVAEPVSTTDNITKETNELPIEILNTTEVQTLPTSLFTLELLSSLNLVNPSLKSDFYEGFIYGFWDTKNEFENLSVLTHTIFTGSDYLATVYEIQTTTEIEMFSTYQTLKEMATNSESGQINETNSYGNASFYFNHSTKTNTVFLTIQKNNAIYSFEYAPTQHAIIRSLIELL